MSCTAQVGAILSGIQRLIHRSGVSSAIDPQPAAPYTAALSERVAQPVEHVTFNHGVLGSSPSALTKQIKHLHQISKSSEFSLWALCWQIDCRSQRHSNRCCIKASARIEMRFVGN
jgi:hypothetical protein